MPSVAWLLVAILLSLLVSQNSVLDFAPFACQRSTIRQFYDAVALVFGSTYDEVFKASNTILAQRISQRCGVSESDTVLELGFGAGPLARILIDEVAVQRYDGLELSEGMLNLTARRVKFPASRHHHLYNSEHPAEFLSSSPFLGMYSLSFALLVLDALEEAEITQLLEALYMRLQPGGRLCVSVLADLSERWTVSIYKTVWRIAPLLFGGRRPLNFQRFIDERLWSLADRWMEDTGWLPTEVFSLEKRGSDTFADSSIKEDAAGTGQALRRWAEYINATSDNLVQLVNVREHAVSSTERFPRGVAKDVAKSWFTALPNSSLLDLVIQDIDSMTKDDILHVNEESYKGMPAAMLVQEMSLTISSMDAKALEDWVLGGNTEGMSAQELRDSIIGIIDGNMEHAKDDIDHSNALFEFKTKALQLTTQAELKELHKTFEKEMLVPVSEMSREELEQTVLENVALMSRDDIEAELLGGIEDASLEELRAELREVARSYGRRDLEDRAAEALDNVEVAVMRTMCQTIAETLLTEKELESLAGEVALRLSSGQTMSEKDEEALGAAEEKTPQPRKRRQRGPTGSSVGGARAAATSGIPKETTVKRPAREEQTSSRSPSGHHGHGEEF